MTPAGKAALLGAIRSGKGFIGAHSATDTFHTGETNDTNTSGVRTWRYKNNGDKADPFVRMLGSEFIVHDKQQIAKALVVDRKFPGMEHLGEVMRMLEEWHSLADFSDNLHVLLVTDTTGVVGPNYQRPPFPNTWARMHGQGRISHTALGHRENVWTNPAFQNLPFGGIAWAVRNVDADVTPNLAKVTPGALQAQAIPQPPPPKPAASTPAYAAGKNPQGYVAMNRPTHFLGLLMATIALTNSTAVANENSSTPEAKRPRILGISHAAFYVGDMAKARAFYKDLLGFAEPYTLPRKDGGELVWIKINDRQSIELFPGSEVAPEADRLFHIALETDDAEGMRV